MDWEAFGFEDDQYIYNGNMRENVAHRMDVLRGDRMQNLSLETIYGGITDLFKPTQRSHAFEICEVGEHVFKEVE